MNQMKLTWKERISFGMGDAGNNVAVIIMSTFLTAYYTDTVGIAAAAIGTMMLVARMFDGISDLIMGALLDRTNTRWGKARPWLLWVTPFMGLGIIAMLNVPGGLSDGGKLVYAYITYMGINCTVYTAFNVAYNALLARMTLDPNERQLTSSVRFILAQALSFVLSSITANLVASMGWRTVSIIYGILCSGLTFVTFIGTREHISEVPDAESTAVTVVKVPLKESIPALLKNRYFYFATLMFLLLFVLQASTGAATYYYCNNVLNNISYMALFSAATTLPAVVLNFIIPSIVKRVGRWKCMMFGCICLVIGHLIIGLANMNVALVFFGLLLKGIGFAPILSGVFAMTADVVDYGDWKFNIRSEGLINSCASFGMKMGIGLGSALLTWILSFGGYVGTASTQTPGALFSIRVAFGFSGAVLAALLLIICAFSNLDKYSAEIQEALKERNQNNN